MDPLNVLHHTLDMQQPQINSVMGLLISELFHMSLLAGLIGPKSESRAGGKSVHTMVPRFPNWTQERAGGEATFQTQSWKW